MTDNPLWEYARRSVRNLGMGLEAGIANMQHGNQAIRQGADATLQRLQGAELTPEESAALQDSPIGGFGTDNIGAAGGMPLIHAGPNSATAKLGYLRNAQRALETGTADVDQIRDRYGWYQQPVSGDWKYEIPDDAAKLIPAPDPALKATEFRVKYPRGYQFVHRELLRAYPELKTITIGVHDRSENPSEAFFNKENNHISLAADLTPDEALKSIVHEFSHPVQQIEGASPGTSPNSLEIHGIAQRKMAVARAAAEDVAQRFNSALNDAWNANKPAHVTLRGAQDFRAQFLRENPRLAAEYLDAQETLRLLDDPYQQLSLRHSLYERALGETEARDAQERRSFTAEQRKAMPPYVLGMRSAGRPIRSNRELFDLRTLPGIARVAADEPDPARIELERGMGVLSPETKALIISVLGLGSDQAELGR